jgi:hypothetical protein
MHSLSHCIRYVSSPTRLLYPGSFSTPASYPAFPTPRIHVPFAGSIRDNLKSNILPLSHRRNATHRLPPRTIAKTHDHAWQLPLPQVQVPPMNESVAPSVRLPYKSSVFHTTYVCAVARTTDSFMGGVYSSPSSSRRHPIQIVPVPLHACMTSQRARLNGTLMAPFAHGPT